MFVLKKKYFLIIQSIKDINLRNIKKYNKFVIIYRNQSNKEDIEDLKRFRKECRLKLIKFFVANDINLCVALNSDGIYLSSYNKAFKSLNLKKSNFNIIGSAHNTHEIALKVKQGCSHVLLSKLFTVDYDIKSSILGVVKFNKYLINVSTNLVPLGGIKISNLNKLNSINCDFFAILSEVKKKPAMIFSRLF
tara:strand:- start:8912 stop:9487 length:576 start_codon:yes stop_codon:yes gene_type:complete